MAILRKSCPCLWWTAILLTISFRPESVMAFIVPTPSTSALSCYTQQELATPGTVLFFRGSADKNEDLSENVSHRLIQKQLARTPQPWQQQPALIALMPPQRTSSTQASLQQRMAQPQQPALKTAMAVPTQQPLPRPQAPLRPTNPPNPAALAATPLSRLIDLRSEYQLVTPPADELALQEGQRLVSMGDVHGDFNALVEFLDTAGVINRQRPDEWVGGDTILVQCGDILDRGSQELACYALLATLSQQAVHHDGAVICLWGNHEALNAMGTFFYTTGDVEYERHLAPRIDQCLQTQLWRLQYAATQEPARWAAYEPGGGLLVAPILSQLKVAVKVGNTVCVHAGLTAQHVREYGGIAGMNAQARQWVQQVARGVAPYNNLGQYSSMDELVHTVQQRAQSVRDQVPQLLGGGPGADSSPVWMRDYSSPHDRPTANPQRTQHMIDAALAALQADRMVMGHSVQKQINAACHGKAWRVDVGASRGVTGGTPEVLEVRKIGGQEVVSVITRGGRRIPAQQRLVEAPTACLASRL